MPSRSIRALAWLGDAEFELEVRRRLCDRGDFPSDRLDAMKAEVVCAERQAALLAELEAEDALDDAERDLVRRARNADVGRRRGREQARTYRSATALEALVGHWRHAAGDADERGDARFDALLSSRIDRAIDEAVARRGTRLRRG